MVQHRLVTLDRLLPLPVVGLGDFEEGFALHTSRYDTVGKEDIVEGCALPPTKENHGSG